MSLTFLAKISAAPKIVSSDFGKLDARRQRMLACACTMAGAAPAASTPAKPAPRTKERRSMVFLLDSGGRRRKVRAILGVGSGPFTRTYPVIAASASVGVASLQLAEIRVRP